MVETLLGRPGHEVDAAFSDLNMLVLPGGRERTDQDYAALFDGVGLQLISVVPTSSRMSILEPASTAPTSQPRSADLARTLRCSQPGKLPARSNAPGSGVPNRSSSHAAVAVVEARSRPLAMPIRSKR